MGNFLIHQEITYTFRSSRRRMMNCSVFIRERLFIKFELALSLDDNLCPRQGGTSEIPVREKSVDRIKKACHLAPLFLTPRVSPLLYPGTIGSDIFSSSTCMGIFNPVLTAPHFLPRCNKTSEPRSLISPRIPLTTDGIFPKSSQNWGVGANQLIFLH